MIQEVLETTSEVTEKGQLTNTHFIAFQISNEFPFSPEPDVVIQEEDDEEDELEEIEEYEEWDDNDEWGADDEWDDEEWEDEEVDWDEVDWTEED